MNKKFILFTIVILSFIPLVIASTYEDCSIYGNCQPIKAIEQFNNNTANVNNSNFLRGLTPQQVANLYTETDPIYSTNLYAVGMNQYVDTSSTPLFPYIYTDALYDTNSLGAIDILNRQAYDLTGTFVMFDWGLSLIYDTLGTLSGDFSNRVFYSYDGSNNAIDYYDNIIIKASDDDGTGLISDVNISGGNDNYGGTFNKLAGDINLNAGQITSSGNDYGNKGGDVNSFASNGETSNIIGGDGGSIYIDAGDGGDGGNNEDEYGGNGGIVTINAGVGGSGNLSGSNGAINLGSSQFNYGGSSYGSSISNNYITSSNDGMFTWNGINDYFNYAEDILITFNKHIYFGAKNSFISSGGSNALDIVSPNINIIPFLPYRVTIGNKTSGADYVLNFDGESSNGNITWMEDEKLFNIQGGINQTIGNSTINMIYGEMWQHNDTGISFAIASSGVYYSVNNTVFNTTNQLLNGVSYIANGTLRPQFSGVYQVDYFVSGSGTANHNYHMAVSVNNIVKYNTETHFRISTGNDVATMSGTGLLRLNANDNVTLVIEDSTGTGTATIYSINLNMERIGN